MANVASKSTTPKVAVVIPNWNGANEIPECLKSLETQSFTAHIIVVENGSADNSSSLIKESFPTVELIELPCNLGFAGGVNVGIRRAVELNYDYVALFNNDAVAEKTWLEHLVKCLEQNPTAGIAACKFMDIKHEHLDSTGDLYTIWGLPYPRGRGEAVSAKYDQQTEVFGASGGASLYRIKMLQQIGLFDEDFFAYYEDVDVSFRAQLAGWKVKYEPTAVAYHRIGATSGKIKGFTTYQTMKNQPILLFKNVPDRFLFAVTWRFMIAHTLFFLRALTRGNGWAALKGDAVGTYLLFKKHGERTRIQASRTVSDAYVWGIMTHDLPPNAHSLRRLRLRWWKLRGKRP